MAKGTTGRRSIGSSRCRASPYPLPAIDESMDSHVKDGNEIIGKEDWEDVTCSVCLEYPHNAVLLLCSSYDKGCRPYMCGTSFRYSNCLDQYKKHTEVTLPHHSQPHSDTIDGNMDKSESVKLICPLCRGQVKGWTVLEPAREYLNTKRRNCMQESCSFVGTFKELRKHVKVDHPSARPHKVDPALKQNWRRLELSRERDDVLSTIRSSMPGSVVFGDYVVESINGLVDSDEEDGFDANARIARIENDFMNMYMFLQAFDPAGNIGSNRVTSRNERDANRALNRGAAMGSLLRPQLDQRRSLHHGATDQDSQGTGGASLGNRMRRHNRVLLGRSERRRRHRYTEMFY